MSVKNHESPIPVAVRVLGLRVRVSQGAWMFVSCECCVLLQVQASATGRSHVQGSPTSASVSLCVITCNNNPLHLQWLGRKVMD
jgi:hypothetical protein